MYDKSVVSKSKHFRRLNFLQNSSIRLQENKTGVTQQSFPYNNFFPIRIQFYISNKNFV